MPDTKAELRKGTSEQETQFSLIEDPIRGIINSFEKTWRLWISTLDF